MALSDRVCSLKRLPLSAAAMLACAAGAVAGPAIPSPLQDAGDYQSGVGRVLTLDALAYEDLRGFSSATFVGFPLEAGGAVNLDLNRINIYTEATRFIVETEDGPVDVGAPDVQLFGGTIEGQPESRVFLSLSPEAVNGYITTSDRTFIITSGPNGFGMDTIVYDLTNLPDGMINWAEFSCHADEVAPIDDPSPGVGSPTEAACRSIDLAIETDQELLALFSGNQANTNAYIATLVGASNEVYTRDVESSFNVVFQRLWTTADPWNSANTSAQLTQFVNYWDANMGSTPRDLAHMLSGRGLGGGIAYLDAICEDFGYGLSANLDGFFPYPLLNNHPQNWDIMVFMHELGHNFGSPHTHDMGIDNCAGGNCTVTPDFGTIMSYCHQCSGGMSNIRLEFHPRSINEAMVPFLNSVSCDITCPADILFAFPDGLPTELDPTGVTPVRVDLIDNGVTPNPAFATFTSGPVGDAGSTQGLVHLGGQQYRADIPPGDCTQEMEFYFSASGNGVDFLHSPFDGPGGSRYSALTVSSFTNVFSDDAQVNTGWTVTNGGTLTDGGWDRGVPVNCNRGDPSADFDGSGAAWLTDNSAANSCNSDVDGGSTTLMSPALDTSGGDAFISYARWFDNSFGASPFEDAFTVQIATSPAGPWTTLEIVGPSGSDVSGGWVYRTFHVSDFVTPGANTRIRFVAVDGGSGSVVEAGVDAISVDLAVCDVATCEADLSGSSDPNSPDYGVPDGVVDSADFFYYLDQFVAGNLAVSDLSGASDPNDPAYGVPDGVLDSSDFFYYLDAFVTPCP